MLTVNPVNRMLMLVSHPELRVNFIASHLGYCWGLVSLVSTSWLSPTYFFTFLLFLVAESFLSQGAVSMPGWETAVSWACALKLLGRSTSWLGVLPGTRHSEQSRALLLTLQCDRVSIHRGLQVVDIFGHDIKCDICEICSIMCSPMIVYGLHFF